MSGLKERIQNEQTALALAALCRRQQDRIESLERQLAEAQGKVAQWQPIETAPKDGEFLLLLVPTLKKRFVPIAGYWMGYWVIVNGDEAIQRIEATHWMPLPLPPSADGKPSDCSDNKVGATTSAEKDGKEVG